MKAFCSEIPALFSTGSVRPGDTVELEPDEARHARALRLKGGDSVILLDGAGRKSLCTVHAAEKRRFSILVRDTVLEEPEEGLYIGLIVGALADKTRLEWLVEKGVELGVREFVPLRSDRSEGFSKTDRLNRVAIAALKQSQRAYLPEIADQTDWDAVLDLAGRYDRVLMLHEQGVGRIVLRACVEGLQGTEKILLLVGPEGGFSDREVELMRGRADTTLVSLGDVRLRAETAGIVALAVLSTMV